MKAFILAAGVSRRLYPHTYSTPKCLLEVGGKAIVDYQLEALNHLGVNEIVIIVGYHRETIIDYVKKKFPQFKFSFVINHHYFETNTAYSVYLGREHLLKSDFLFSTKSFQSEKINLAYIYKNADSVIGSVSGATHFPSLIFNKPTLYIADIPLHHIYLYYSFKKNWKNNFNIDNFVIPKDDYWVMINLFNYSYSSLSSRQSYIEEIEDFSSLERTIYNFLQNNLDQEKIIDRDNFYDLAIKQFKKDKDKNYFYSNYGKILIHKKYKYSF